MLEIPLTAAEVLERYYLEARAKLLEVAATLDRIDRADGAAQLKDNRRQLLTDALSILKGDSPNRAELLQQHLSRRYDANWMSEFGLPKSA